MLALKIYAHFTISFYNRTGWYILFFPYFSIFFSHYLRLHLDWYLKKKTVVDILGNAIYRNHTTIGNLWSNLAELCNF